MGHCFNYGTFLKVYYNAYETLKMSERLTAINLHDNKLIQLPRRFFANGMSHTVRYSIRHMDQFQLLDLSCNHIPYKSSRNAQLT